MICISCNKDTPDTEMYCTHCGVKMDVTYDEMKNKLHQDIKKDKEEETAAFCRWLLAISIALFVTAMIFRSMWTNPPLPNTTPGYIPESNITHKVIDITQPIIIWKKKK